MSFVKIGELRIHYAKKGRGEPLVFFPGMNMDYRAYKGLINLLSKKYCVYAIDIPMFGKSSKPKKYISLKSFAPVMKKLFTKLNIKNPIICGHSAGGMIGIEYCVNNPVKKLILLDSGGVPDSRSLMVRFFYIFIGTRTIQLFQHPLKVFIIYWVGGYNLLRNGFNKKYWKMYKEELQKDYSEASKKIKYPTLIIWGKKDKLCPLEHGRIFHKNIKDSKLIVVDGDHDWPIVDYELAENLF